eukprot:m.191116 g.191116  ORF g.191116 m.191116 type:complete len:569 (-) comp18244_c0_seq1:140-1846(-)
MGEYALGLDTFTKSFDEAHDKILKSSEATGLMLAFFDRFVKVENAYAASLEELCDTKTARLSKMFHSQTLESVSELSSAWTTWVDEYRQSGALHRQLASAMQSGVCTVVTALIKDDLHDQAHALSEIKRHLKFAKAAHTRFMPEEVRFVRACEDLDQEIALMTRAFVPPSPLTTLTFPAGDLAALEADLGGVSNGWDPDGSIGSQDDRDADFDEALNTAVKHSPAVQQLIVQRAAASREYSEARRQFLDAHEEMVKVTKQMSNKVHNIEGKRIEVLKEALKAMTRITVLCAGVKFDQSLEILKTLSQEASRFFPLELALPKVPEAPECFDPNRLSPPPMPTIGPGSHPEANASGSNESVAVSPQLKREAKRWFGGMFASSPSTERKQNPQSNSSPSLLQPPSAGAAEPAADGMRPRVASMPSSRSTSTPSRQATSKQAVGTPSRQATSTPIKSSGSTPGRQHASHNGTPRRHPHSTSTPAKRPQPHAPTPQPHAPTPRPYAPTPATPTSKETSLYDASMYMPPDSPQHKGGDESTDASFSDDVLGSHLAGKSLHFGSGGGGDDDDNDN